MPRFTWVTEGPGGPVESGQQFNACRHCKGDPVMLNAVVARRLDVPQDATPKHELRTVPHRSFDFSPSPIACAACGRILEAEDD